MLRIDIRLRILTVVTGVALLTLACSSEPKSDSQATSQDTSTAVIAPPADSLTIELTGLDSLSVFELLEKTHKVKYHPTALGVFVTGIDSINNDARHYWVYSVNDSMPQIASDKYLTATGDHIVWHYRKIE